MRQQLTLASCPEADIVGPAALSNRTMMVDRYKSFAALEARETLDVHYRIRLADRGTAVVVLAPHGGKIEPGTSEIAIAIAQETYSYYCFEGLTGGRPHSDLHITSNRFDEPRAVNLVSGAETAIAIHGRQDRLDPATVWMGGRNSRLRDEIANLLNSGGFLALSGGHSLTGEASDNICNRGMAGAGVQLELPATLRDRLLADQDALQRFAVAIRAVLANL